MEADDDLGDGVLGVGAAERAAEAAQEEGLAERPQPLELPRRGVGAARAQVGEVACSLHQGVARLLGLVTQGRSHVIGTKTRLALNSIPPTGTKILSSKPPLTLLGPSLPPRGRQERATRAFWT